MQDKENIQKESEKQMNELCATLEKYKVYFIVLHVVKRIRNVFLFSIGLQFS